MKQKSSSQKHHHPRWWLVIAVTGRHTNGCKLLDSETIQLGEKEMEDIPILKIKIETEEYIYEEYLEA